MKSAMRSASWATFAVAGLILGNSAAWAQCGGSKSADAKSSGSGGYMTASDTGGKCSAQKGGCTKDAKAEGKRDGKDILSVAKKAGSFQTLTKAIEVAGLSEALSGKGPFTVFAPTDEAFGQLPEGTLDALVKDAPKLRAILKYHVIPGRVTGDEARKLTSAKTLLGQSVTLRTASPLHVNDARVTQTDIVASNGIIHVIDKVILPKDDVIDVARSAGSFKTLLKAIDAAGLADTLRSEGPFTVFAPTDEAFAKLPAGTLESLVGAPEKLRGILLYHVVPGRVMAADVVKLDEAKTAQGQKVHIQASDEGVRVDNARVLKTDVPAANGVIHVIDSVILPK